MVDGFLVVGDLRGPNKKLYADLELTAREKKALGDFVSQWSVLEQLLLEYCEFLCRLTKGDIPPNVYSDSLRQRMRGATTLAREVLRKAPVEQAKALAFLTKLSGISAQAHKLRHGVLVWSKKNRRHLEVHSRKNPHGKPWLLTTAELEGWGRKIAEMNVEFIWLHGMETGLSSPRRRGKSVSIGPDQLLPVQQPSGWTVVRPTSLQGRKPQPPTSKA